MSVLILGATSPIARAIAMIYASRGLPVAVATRTLEDAEAIAADLHVRYGTKTIAVAFDAVAFDQHEAMLETIEEDLGPLSVALLAFGDMGAPPTGDVPFEQVARVIDTNYTGAVSLAEAIARRMESRERGAIIGLCSVAGERGRASNYIYGSAKGAFALYLGGLRNRLFEHNVNVLTVKLGFVDTRMTFGMETNIPVASPEKVARAVVKASDRGEDVMFYPRFWAGIMGVIRSIPESIFKRMSL